MTAQYEERDTCIVFPARDRDGRFGPWTACDRTLRLRRKPCATASPDLRSFKSLVENWHNQTWHISSIKKRTSHPDYLKIIGMGMVAVPWILQELRATPDYWFTALEAITREDPAPHAETMHELRDAWLAWGEEHGYPDTRSMARESQETVS
jgi:hypothetical protein